MSATSAATRRKGFADEERAATREADRAMGAQLHSIIKASATALRPTLWYGMPAYGNKDGKMVCFFEAAQKFKTRYATLGFSDKANLEGGAK